MLPAFDNPGPDHEWELAVSRQGLRWYQSALLGLLCAYAVLACALFLYFRYVACHGALNDGRPNGHETTRDRATYLIRMRTRHLPRMAVEIQDMQAFLQATGSSEMTCEQFEERKYYHLQTLRDDLCELDAEPVYNGYLAAHSKLRHCNKYFFEALLALNDGFYQQPTAKIARKQHIAESGRLFRAGLLEFRAGKEGLERPLPEDLPGRV